MQPGALGPACLFLCVMFVWPTGRLDFGSEGSRLPVVETLPAGGRNLVIAGETAANVPGDRLVAWVRRIEDLRRGPHVLAVGRFSNPPRLQDLDGLTLGDPDLKDIRRCRPGDCAVKLSAAEMDLSRRTVASAGTSWKLAVQVAFRAVLLARVRAYLEHGLAGSPPYDDRSEPVWLAAEFAQLIEHGAGESLGSPALMEYLTHYPHVDSDPFESFLYWSKDTFGRKPIVSVTHVAIEHSGDPALPRAVVASRQVYASHYMTGSLAFTALLGGGSEPGTLHYVNHSRVDGLDGPFGWLVRRVVDRRVRSGARDLLDGVRRRLESGEPPDHEGGG